MLRPQNAKLKLDWAGTGAGPLALDPSLPGPDRDVDPGTGGANGLMARRGRRGRHLGEHQRWAYPVSSRAIPVHQISQITAMLKSLVFPDAGGGSNVRYRQHAGILAGAWRQPRQRPAVQCGACA